MNRSYESPVRGQLTVYNNKVLCTRFRDQKFDPDFVFPATRLPGAKDPPNALRPEDLRENNSNFQFRGRGRGGGRGGKDGLRLFISYLFFVSRSSNS